MHDHDCDDFCQPKCPPPCPPPNITTDNVTYAGPADSCTGVTKSMILTDVIKKLIISIKSRVYGVVSNTLKVTYPANTCQKQARIEFVPSTDPGNTIVFGTDGLPYASGGGGITCAALDAIVDLSPSKAQNNTVDPTTYTFLINNSLNEDCGSEKLSAPTGFAVTGNTRVSAFGKMEFYPNLIAANNAAAEGETVLIFKDTTEGITLKNNVHYQGIGFHSIGLVTIALGTTGLGTNRITNLKLTLGIDCPANAANKIIATNVEVLGSTQLNGSLYWDGGNFSEDGTNTLLLSNNARIINFTSKRPVTGIENAQLDFGVINWDGDGGAGLTLTNSMNANHTKASHITINVTGLNSYGAFFQSIGNVGGAISASHITANSISGVGVYAHNGAGEVAPNPNTANERSLNLNYITGTSITGDGFVAVCNFGLEAVYGSQKPNIGHCNGFSTDGRGMVLINGNIKNCTAYSVNNYGLFINGTEDGFGHNTVVTDCISESNNSYALGASGDFYINGGSYITNSTTVGPVIINTGNATHGEYFIDSIKTIQRNKTAFSITATSPVTARISRNSFLCQDLLVNVPGINTALITPRAVVIDAFDNIT